MSDPVLDPVTFVRVAGPATSVPWTGRVETMVRPLRFRRVGEPVATMESATVPGDDATEGASVAAAIHVEPAARDVEFEARLAELEAREFSVDEKERRTRAKEQELEDERLRLAEAIATLASTRASLLARSEGELLDLATAIAGAILGTELDLHPDKVVRFVEAGLSHLGPSTRAVVRLSPAAAEIVRGRLGDRFEWEGTEVRLESDPAFDGLGCVVLGDTGTVDVRVEERLARVRDAIREERNTLGEDAR